MPEDHHELNPNERQPVGPQTLLTRSALPIIGLLFLLGLSLTYLQLSRNQDILVERTAVQHAQVYSHILDRIRELYASEVVHTAKESGLEVTHDYRNHKNAIPLPITLSRSLEHKLGPAEMGTTAKVYSPMPFEWREELGGLPDDFAEEAWAKFEENPKRKDFYKIEPYKGVVSLRYAVPQVMEEACIECHNTYDGSPKTDWAVNDVRGIMEVVYPLEQAEALAQHSIWETFGILSPMLLLALLMLGLNLKQHRRWNSAMEARLRAQQQAKQELRASQERYQTVLETTPDFNMIVNANGTIEFVNRVGGAGEIGGIGSNLLSHLEDEDAATVRAAMDRALVSGELVTVQFQKQGTKDHPVYFSARIQKLADTENRLLIISTDISAQKRLELQARQAQRMQAVGRLAGGVAHDFNNLLTAIVSFGSFAMKTLKPEDPAYKDLEQVLEAAGRGEELTKQLLAFSRHHKTSSKVVDVNQTIEGVEAMLRRLLGAQVEFHVDLGADLKNVRIDGASLDQVIVNLALNSRDAMTQGGELLISTEAVTMSPADAVSNGLREAGEYIKVAVTDTGEGMDEHTMRHMFDPFFTTKGAGKGTGLGLATCWGIVQQAGGQIDVNSEPGDGTTITFYLPGVDAEVTSAQDKTGHHELKGTETIVVVEDDDPVRESVIRALRDYGYHVIEACDGEDALQICEISPPGSIDLVLTDVVMPRMGGKELAERVVQFHPGVKLLYMSGYTDDLTLGDGVHGVELLEKPFKPEELAAKVRGVLDSESQSMGAS